MHPQRLTPNPPKLGCIGDRAGSRSIVHVAQTARRKPHSGLVARLKEPERAQPERQQGEESPGPRRADGEEQHDQHPGRRQRYDTEPASPLLAAWSYVGNDGDG